MEVVPDIESWAISAEQVDVSGWLSEICGVAARLCISKADDTRKHRGYI